MTATRKGQIGRDELGFAVSGVASLSSADLEAVVMRFENPARPVFSLDPLPWRSVLSNYCA